MGVGSVSTNYSREASNWTVNVPPREHHGSWRGETMVFICLCGCVVTAALRWNQSLCCLHTNINTHKSLYKKKKKNSNAFGLSLEHYHWLTGSREILWPRLNIKKACLYWFKSLPLNYTYCICMVLRWSLSPWHLKDFWALWIGNDWQEPLAA